MKTITIHYTTPYIGTIAKQGEHNQTELVFYLPDNFNGADFVNAEFVKRDGSTSVVDQLVPNNGTVAVPLTQDLTNVDGKMEIQLVAYKVDGTEITEIAKSSSYTCKIRKSLNVLYGEDQPGVIERILAFISYWAEKLPEMWAKKHWHDNKELLDTITPEMLAGEQSDWNENDETEKSFVKNRTHYSETTATQVLFSYEYDDDTWAPTSEAGSDGHAFPLAVGKEYKLTYNGTEYTFTGTLLGETSVVCIGNLNIADEEYVPQQGDFPFVLAYFAEGSSEINNLLALESLQGEIVSFGIVRESTVYHPLDVDYLPKSAKDAIEMKHTHANKTVLDNFSTSTAYPFTFLEFAGHTVPQFPINDVQPTTEGGNDYYLNWINPNVWYRFGGASSPVASVSIYQLQGVDNSVAEEYVVEFWTGATAPSPVIFPSDIEWPDGSEPVWGANKHYQVSIVGNMGLYAESDYSGEE